MEGGALFNPGFIGGDFLWWIGQVADKSTWQENQKDSKHQSSSEIPGWGYRYKVRIIGIHDQGEGSLESEQLPWAQVMYPVTSGGGQGKSYQSPAIQQGMFVFGFFLDGQDQQVPVIMGVLGANPQVPKSTLTGITGGQNFTAQSGNADKVADDDLLTERPAGRTLTGQPTGGDNPNNPPTDNVSPTKESPAAPHQETMADKRKDAVLKKKHPLFCPDPQKQSPLKGIQTVIEDLQEKIRKLQEGIEGYARAIRSDINIVNSLINQINEIDALIRDASCEIAKFLRTLIGLVQDFVTDLFTEVLQPLFKISPPTIRIEILDKLVKGLELIECLFNAIGLKLCDSAERSIKGSFARRASGRPAPASVQPFLTDQYADIPWFPSDGDNDTYNPTPICYVEELVGEILGENINDIINTFDSATLPVVKDIETALNDVGGPGTSAAGSSGTRPRDPLLPTIPNLPAIPSFDPLGALGGAGFDIASALGFLSAISGIFSCDISILCSPNSYHTLQDGGNGKPSSDEPSNVEIAKRAQTTAESQEPTSPPPTPPKYTEPPALLYDSNSGSSAAVDNRTQAQRRADRVARLGEARVAEIEARDAAARRAGAE